MKKTTKDVILLCKGYYNKEKYPNILEALRQYYRENYCSSLEDAYLTEKFISQVILSEVMSTIVSKYPDRLACFINLFLLSNQYAIYGIYEDDTEYYHQIFHRVTYFLSNLRMRGDGFIEIDTDGYFEKHVDEDGNTYRVLIEDIIRS